MTSAAPRDSGYRYHQSRSLAVDVRARCLTQRMADLVLDAGRPAWRIAPVSSVSACGLARQIVTPESRCRCRRPRTVCVVPRERWGGTGGVSRERTRPGNGDPMSASGPLSVRW